MAVTRIGLNLVLTSADLSDLLALCSPALSRLSPCPAQGWGPDLPTSQSLPPCGERPQRFPFSLSQARSPRTPPRPRARVPGESEGARGRPYGGHGPAWSRPSASAASLPQLSSETLSFSFTVERDVPVQGLKPAQVKVYDYYETGECGAGGAPGGGPPLPRASALGPFPPPAPLPPARAGPREHRGCVCGGGDDDRSGVGGCAGVPAWPPFTPAAAVQPPSPEGAGRGGHPPSPPSPVPAPRAEEPSPAAGPSRGRRRSRLQGRPQSAAAPALAGRASVPGASAVPAAGPGWQRRRCPQPTPASWGKVPGQPLGLCEGVALPRCRGLWTPSHPDWVLGGEAGDGGSGRLWGPGGASLWHPSLCQGCRGALTARLLPPLLLSRRVCHAGVRRSLLHR